ncbi:MAG: hypothetical protein HZB10_01825 [Candidatus Yonathbacteria bacterium]|nr:hypothetical protein [Candidatus Yonathbacteria bacterium]
MNPQTRTRKPVVIPEDEYFIFTFIAPLLPLSAIFATWYFGGVTLEWAIFLSFVWMGSYILWGFRIISNTEYVVIERFGEFSRVVHSGPRLLCLPGIIDKVVVQGTLRWQELRLFAYEEGKREYKVDFKNGSTLVDIKASIRVGPQGQSLNDLNKAIYLFTYSFKNDSERMERIENVLESALVPKLQALEIDKALEEKDAIAEVANGDECVIETLISVGIELNSQKGVIIADIILPPEIIAQRQKKLEGQSEAEKQSAQGLGYARSIMAVKQALACTLEEATAIYQTQRGLETIATTGSNISFVASDIKGVQRTLGVAEVQTHQRRKG